MNLQLFGSVEDALAHPYLTSLHDISDEPTCPSPFSFDFEQHALTEEQMRELIYREALAFNPEYQQTWGHICSSLLWVQWLWASFIWFICLRLLIHSDVQHICSCIIYVTMETFWCGNNYLNFIPCFAASRYWSEH